MYRHQVSGTRKKIPPLDSLFSNYYGIHPGRNLTSSYYNRALLHFVACISDDIAEWLE
jgi:hypothetical protein